MHTITTHCSGFRHAPAALLLLALIGLVPGCKDSSKQEVASSPEPAAAPASTDDTRAITRDAYIYGFPVVDNYRIQYAYFVDRNDPEYKAPWNTLYNNARVYTPDDRAIQTPNSDTPYSFVGADLRAEPLVFTVPAIEKDRFYHLQFIDMYTHNFAYVGTRATGNGAGNFLLAGPDWKGDKPAGITSVIHSETQFAFVLYRTQLFNPTDIENVKKVQAGYKVQPLSKFLGQPAPPAAPAIDFPKPLSVDDERKSLDFFKLLNFTLQFAPTHSSEVELMQRFAKIGVGAGKAFDPAALTPDTRAAMQGGIEDGLKALEQEEKDAQAGKFGSGDIFGTREHLKNNYLYRMLAAVDGIYGNSKEEALYHTYYGNAADHDYVLRFAPNQYPPVDAFWSVTMYDMPASLLVANPIKRYLINSPMLPQLKKDADGGLTIYIQHASPGKDKESNWLPAPAGQMKVALRLYAPKPEAQDGTWKWPTLQQAR